MLQEKLERERLDASITIAQLETALKQKKQELEVAKRKSTGEPGPDSSRHLSAAEYDALKRKYNDLYQSNATTCNTLKHLTERYHLERQRWRKWVKEWHKDYNVQHAGLHVVSSTEAIASRHSTPEKKRTHTKNPRSLDLTNNGNEDKENSRPSSGRGIEQKRLPSSSPQKLCSATQRTESLATDIFHNQDAHNIAFNALAEDPKVPADDGDVIVKDEPENSLFNISHREMLLPNSYDLMTPAVTRPPVQEKARTTHIDRQNNDVQRMDHRRNLDTVDTLTPLNGMNLDNPDVD